MADTMVLTADEIQTLRSFQSQYVALTSRYGDVFFQSKLINAELSTIESQMETLEKNRIDFVEVLQGKYGVGSVNITTGEFTPTPTT